MMFPGSVWTLSRGDPGKGEYGCPNMPCVLRIYEESGGGMAPRSRREQICHNLPSKYAKRYDNHDKPCQKSITGVNPFHSGGLPGRNVSESGENGIHNLNYGAFEVALTSMV